MRESNRLPASSPEWLMPEPIDFPEALCAVVGGHPLVSQTLARRGTAEPSAALAFLDPGRYVPSPPGELPGMERAVTRLARAIRARERICVWGDFDVDGQTATALLVSTLQELGAAVRWHVPQRETEGHGIRVPVLARVIEEGARLVLTCDTGIAAHEAIAFARSHRVDVVVTDHHDLSETLPVASAVVNPKMLAEEHPLRDLPGVGVAYKLAEALCETLRRPGAASQHLDLVALGIVADLAIQRADTRYLLQLGLTALRRSERLGLRVLLESAELSAEHFSEEHISFVLAPRLNAAGRLADAAACVALLTTEDLTQARIVAAELEALNARRKLLCDQVEQAAETQLARDPALLELSALVVAGPGWPPGVVGIVASRLVERYGKPAILISVSPDGMGRASARSIEGINISAAIAAHAAMLPPGSFGGHPMAAGFAIEAERIPEFRRGLARTVDTMLGEAPSRPVLRIDGMLPLRELSLDRVDDLSRLAPFGPGNPPLTLIAERMTLRASRPLGRNDEHRLLLVTDSQGSERQVIWWDGGSEETFQNSAVGSVKGLFDLAYVARAATFRGVREVQLEYVASRPTPGTAPPEVRLRPSAQVIDRRHEPSPRTALEELVAAGGVAVWREGEGTEGLPGGDRQALPAAPILAIWTAPPGPAELRAALAQVSPSRVVLFGLEPAAAQPEAFLRRLAGLSKHTIRAHGGRASMGALAAMTAQRENVVRLGLEWLAARGHVRILAEEGGELTMLPGDGALRGETELAVLAAKVESGLAEAAAYRAYFRSADKNALLRGYVPTETETGEGDGGGRQR